MEMECEKSRETDNIRSERECVYRMSGVTRYCYHRIIAYSLQPYLKIITHTQTSRMNHLIECGLNSTMHSQRDGNDTQTHAVESL